VTTPNGSVIIYAIWVYQGGRIGEYTNYRTRGAWRLFGDGQPEGDPVGRCHVSVHGCSRAGEHLKNKEVSAMRGSTWS